ncbi:MAG: 30S ribosomal protein S6 [Candidatus Magasanikbacteria bacterium CG10_big_fil_rev_8_21_14_0_10_40_10]|uniref:Small ribosomal subunit protein bS6 n=1 Tax=Candidatus Magasanikbacteria bacterium CG10_big_fil_rev_8_21_14_0_10_40_10 TaxID=1974648 RepID=A0A2M6W4M1_9BACT|nr:MAG: 30S ribosomal protein S6 [Candidatus Magasanikbacteria bacterium CG10_big_fil_rev_8_21_14_0_10_40_10]
MKKYELILSLPGTLDDKEVEQEVQVVLETVKKISVDPQVNNLGKIRLAYPINQIRYGYYYSVVFNAEENDAAKLNRDLQLNKNLLRAVLNVYNEKVKPRQSLNISGMPPIKKDKEAEVKEKMSLNDVMTDQETTEEVVAKEKTENKKEVNIDDIDKKLDEILENGELTPGI